MVLKEQPLVGLRKTRCGQQRVFAYLGNINNLPFFVLSFTQPTPSGYEYPHGSDYPTQRTEGFPLQNATPPRQVSDTPLLDAPQNL